MATHKELDIWKLGIDLVESIYSLTNSFPKEETYGLTSQLRRAAVSIPSNIAEGSARKGNNENIQFLYVALGSLAEIETQLVIAERLKFINSSSALEEDVTTLRKKLLNYIKYVKTLKS